MASQEFSTLDVLKLEVERDPEPGALVNLIDNPNGELGGWGWLTPVNNTRVRGAAGALTLDTTVTQATHMLSEPKPMTAGHYAGARFVLFAGSAATVGVRARIVFLNAAGAVVSSGPQTALFNHPPAAIIQVGAVVAPAGTAKVQLRVDAYTSGGNLAANAWVAMQGFTLATSPTSTELGSVRVNLARNPSFEGALAPNGVWEDDTAPEYAFPGAAVGTSTAWFVSGTRSLRMYRGDGLEGRVGASLPRFTVTPGLTYRLRGTVRAAGSGAVEIPTYLYLGSWSSSGTPVGGLVQVGTTSPDSVTPETFDVAVVPPSGAAYSRLVVRTARTVAGTESVHLDSVVHEQRSDAVPSYFDGSTPDAGGVDYAWQGTAHNSASTATDAGSLSYIPPVVYLDVLGPTHTIDVVREELSVGTLTAMVLDATLAPYDAEGIRPGRRCRLLVTDDGGVSWEPLFTGKVTTARVTLDQRRDETDLKRARVELTATDNVAELVSVGRAEGVATIAELPYVLEGAGVPWNVNGSGDQVATATVVAVNENASALDQIAVTRDSVLGHAWVDRHNVLQAWDTASMPGAGGTYVTVAPTDYSGVEVDYDTERCINHVTIKFLRLDPGTSTTEEVTYGPYVDAESVAQWGAHAAEFTVQWADEDPVAIAAHAQAILDANATPEIRVLGVTVPVVSLAQLDPAAGVAMRDLTDLVRVTGLSADVPNVSRRVARVEHHLRARPRGNAWTMALGFANIGAVATPQVTPSPPTGGGGLTLSQLLRPVGEVTMWYGAVVQIPAGWLRCDGTAIPAEYPELIALVGANTPDMRDVFPIGAGPKALGTSGGAPTAPVPPHVHSTANAGPANAEWATPNTGGNMVPRSAAFSQHNHGNTGAATGDAFSIMPPWRALHFIIRAK